MTISEAILATLSDKQATTDAIAGVLEQHPAMIAALCVQLEKDGFVSSHNLGDPAIGEKLIVWRLTQKTA